MQIRGYAPALLRPLVGRDDDITSVTQLITKSINVHVPGIVVTHGPAGIGKSTMVAALARSNELGQLFPDGCLWAGLGETPDLLQSLRGWGRAIRIRDTDLLRLDDAVKSLRTTLRGRRMLFLVDDVWTEQHAEPLRVADAGSVILYTTRKPVLARILAIASWQVYPLKGLKDNEGLALLAEIAEDVVREFPDLCEQLVKDVGGLPLAIVVAGRMLSREAVVKGDLKNMLLSIRDDARLLLEQPVPQDMVNLLDQTTPSVAAVLRRSTDALDDRYRAYFSRLGVLPPSPESFNAVVPATRWEVSRREANQILRFFVELGLLDSTRRGRYQIHPLMQALALREWELRND